MRTTLLIVAIATLSGCAGTSHERRPSQSRDRGLAPQGTPVVKENPKLSERSRASQQQEAEREDVARTHVEGNVIR